MSKEEKVREQTREEFWRRIIITVVEIAAIIFVIWMIILASESIVFSEAKADRYDDVVEAYVLCDDFVYIRQFPNNNNEPLGRFETGDMVFLDGKKKNGYLHCVDLSLEASEGWIHKGYVVYDKPIKVNQRATIVSKGRLAARKNVNGKRTRWLKSQASLKVYFWSDEWCVTDCGYVQTRYLELDGE